MAIAKEQIRQIVNLCHICQKDCSNFVADTFRFAASVFECVVTAVR
jgi:hypothetical protein